MEKFKIDFGNLKVDQLAYVEDSDLYLEEFKKKGIEILQAGHIINVRFTYMDSEQKFGCIIELLEQISRRKKKR